MVFENPLILGLVLAGSGLLFWLAAAGLIRWVSRPQQSLPDLEWINTADNANAEPILIVEAGGRLAWINTTARQLFGLKEGESANLERLARKTRPPNGLLNLCLADSQTRLIIEGKAVEAVSQRLPLGQPELRLITFRSAESGGVIGASQTNLLPAQTLQVFLDLTQAMASSLDVEQTLFSILDNLDRLVPADLREINLYDEDGQTFTPYRMLAMADGDRRL
ncbi:MAG: hypothetical protein ACK4SN_13680, partial [Bellilinea sp.]